MNIINQGVVAALNCMEKLELMQTELKEAIDVIKEYQHGWDHGDLAKDFMAKHKTELLGNSEQLKHKKGGG